MATKSLFIFIEGLVFGSLNVLLMFSLEYVYSSDDVQRLRERDGGKELHNAGIRASIFNSIFLGAITYYFTITYCCVPGPLTVFQQISSVIKFLLIENLWYYCAHWLMHRRAFYWMHRFHHKFNAIVLPSSASAVSIPEFLLAYMAPFLLGAWAGSCDKCSAIYSATVVAVSNLAIHTPALEEKMQYLPWFLVMPSDHVTHHRQLTCNYGAPLIHFDRVFSCVNGVIKKLVGIRVHKLDTRFDDTSDMKKD
jgi:sterol desaturase/sphingolipid hydroxylase (fatty acid hydroxylase superfamily)